MIFLKTVVIILDLMLLYAIVTFSIRCHFKIKYKKEYKRYEYYWNFLISDEMLVVFTKNKKLYSDVVNVQRIRQVDTESYRKAYYSCYENNELLYNLIIDYLPGEKQKIRNNTIKEILN